MTRQRTAKAIERDRANSKDWYANNSAIHQLNTSKRYKQRRETVEGRASTLFTGARQRAVIRGEPLLLTLEHVIEGIRRGRCPRTGMWFDLRIVERHKQNPCAPSLDRINSQGPYSNENVQVVCWQYNAMKQALTPEELLFFC